MLRRLGWFGVLALLVVLAGSMPDVSGATGAAARNGAYETAAAEAAASVSAATGPAPVPVSQPATTEQVTGPDYPGAGWVSAAPTNFSVTDRPHDYPIDMIVIHDTETTFAGAIRIFQDPTRLVSAHYVVSARGQIAQMVPEKDIAWHAGNWDYNTRAIGIEHEGFATVPGTYTAAEYQASAHLVASICSRWGVPVDRSHVIGHSQVPDADHPGLFGGYSHRTDPGPYWDWGYFMGLAAAYARALPSPPRMMVDPVAINGLDSATVTWQPAHSCRLPILGYTVVAQPGDLTSYLPASATTVTFNDLQPATSYTFTVTASTADGHDSLTSNAVVPGRCSAVRLGAVPSSPQPYGAGVVLYGTSIGCSNPLYAFALEAPGSTTWTVVQPYSKAAAYAWNTTGGRSGTYSVMVLVRDAASPGTYFDALATFDDRTDADYAVTPTPCASVTVSTSPGSTAMSGTEVTVTAVASGCPEPQYEFWIRAASETGWQLAQAYSLDAAFSWDSAGRPPGAVDIAVWVRDASRAGSSDASAMTWYSLTAQPRRAPGRPDGGAAGAS